MFAEPEKTPWDLSFDVAGIPVRVHPMFWLFTLVPFLGDRNFDALEAGLWLATVFISILIHELGHAVAARLFGARPWIVLYGFGGLAMYRPGEFRAGPDATLRSVLISFAGPAAGFLLAGLVAGSLVAMGLRVVVDGIHVEIDHQLEQTSVYLASVVRNLIYVNLVWNLLNLLPVLPLDGGKIAEAVLLRVNGTLGVTQTILMSIFLSAVVAVYAGVYGRSPFLVVLFGLLAFQNLQLWQARSGR